MTEFDELEIEESVETNDKISLSEILDAQELSLLYEKIGEIVQKKEKKGSMFCRIKDASGKAFLCTLDVKILFINCFVFDVPSLFSLTIEKSNSSSFFSSMTSSPPPMRKEVCFAIGSWKRSSISGKKPEIFS